MLQLSIQILFTLSPAPANLTQPSSTLSGSTPVGPGSVGSIEIHPRQLRVNPGDEIVWQCTASEGDVGPFACTIPTLFGPPLVVVGGGGFDESDPKASKREVVTKPFTVSSRPTKPHTFTYSVKYSDPDGHPYQLIGDDPEIIVNPPTPTP